MTPSDSVLHVFAATNAMATAIVFGGLAAALALRAAFTETGKITLRNFLAAIGVFVLALLIAVGHQYKEATQEMRGAHREWKAMFGHRMKEAPKIGQPLVTTGTVCEIKPYKRGKTELVAIRIASEGGTEPRGYFVCRPYDEKLGKLTVGRNVRVTVHFRLKGNFGNQHWAALMVEPL